MAYTEIQYDVADRIATVTLNRPDRLNAYTGTMGQEMRAAMRAATDDPGVRVIILTGAGRGFCAGADMNNLNTISSRGRSKEAAVNHAEAAAGEAFDPNSSPDFQTQHSYFPAVPKPILAAINGACAGLGLVYALYCDRRFAAQEARFTTAFARRGLIAEHGISWTLPRVAGLANALDLLMSARKFDAAEAQRLGVVDQVVPGEQLLKTVRAYAQDLADNVSPRSMAVMKRQLWSVDRLSLRQAIEVGNQEMIESFTSEDFKEGVAHFVEKRQAQFTGR